MAQGAIPKIDTRRHIQIYNIDKKHLMIMMMMVCQMASCGDIRRHLLAYMALWMPECGGIYARHGAIWF